LPDVQTPTDSNNVKASENGLAVSVVIPGFNRPQLTLRAVRSVLTQSWERLEVLVIDDGSDPNQVYPSNMIDDERVRLIRHPVNLGVSAARNTGVQASRFPLIAFLDSDDRWLPEKLAGQMVTYYKHGASSNLFVYSSYYLEEGTTRAAYPLISRRRNESLSDFLFLGCSSVNTSTWLTSRALLQQFPFNVRLSQCEDYDVLLRMEAAGVELVHCDIPAVVTNCDPRGDRLSERLRREFYVKFLEHNDQRMTPMSYVVLESIVLNGTHRGSLGSKIHNHITHFLKSPRLGWTARIHLVITYLVRRCTIKLRSRLNHTRTQGVEV
jgi:glycosyltransferase involved in cell wall biosynthesis